MVLVSCFNATQAQCVFFSFDDFEGEGFGPPLCAVPYEMVTENWTNIEGDDETNWVPWVGDTPTGGTGPSLMPVFDTDIIFSGASTFEGATISLRALEKEREAQRSIDTGKYIYVESTDCCGNTAILESDTFDFSNHTTVGMLFLYHMYGTTMGSLAMEVSADGGQNWSNVWEEPDPTTGWMAATAAGSEWNLGGANLSTHLAGASEAIIRLTATVGAGGEYSDIALDNLFVFALESLPSVHNEGTLDYQELSNTCRARITFDKPSDLCSSVDHTLQSAELRLDLNMGEHFLFGGTDLDSGITVKYRLDQQGSGCLLTDTFTLAITDDLHPEQLTIHDFALCYHSSDWIDIYFESITVGENPEFPAYLDDVQFHIEVDIHEHINAYGKAVSLQAPMIPSGGGPVQFSWSPTDGVNCDYPTYRFQLLRLHDFGGSAVCPRSKMGEHEWTRSALTLEVGEPNVDLSMLEGSGHYAWRVMPIGDLHQGGAGNDLNWGDYSAFSAYSTASSNLQNICSTENGVFEYTDPDEDKNRAYTRNFSRNLNGPDESLLVQEAVSFKSGSGFTQQTHVLFRSKGVALTQANVRSYRGMTPLQIMPIPLEKENLNYEQALIRNAGDTRTYSPENFDSDIKFREPEAMSQSAASSVGRYWSDEHNTDISTPSSEGYPFSAIEFTRDGTNRPLNKGLEGETLRLRPDGYTSKIKYGSVTKEELTRIFGNEAPKEKKVEKIITISPENITSVTYIDLTGRTLATCLASNPNVDEDKFALLTPEQAFGVSNEINAQSTGDPYLFEAQTELTFEEEMTLELDYALDEAVFQSNCLSFCRTCDHKVHVKIVDLDGTDVVFADTIDVDQESCEGGLDQLLGVTEWNDMVTLDAGRYMLHYEVRLNNSNGLSTYLDQAREALAAELTVQMGSVTDTLEAELQDIVDETTTLGDFFEYCDNAVADGSATAHDEDSDGFIDYYLFGLGEEILGSGACDEIRVDTDTCKYNCNPETRDFEAFVTDIAGEAMRQRVYVDGLISLEDGEPLDIEPVCPSGISGVCMFLTGGRGWFNMSGGSVDWNSPKNIAALNYDVDDGDFNQVIETMLQANADAPEIYDTYSCLNIYAQLEAISQNLLYYTSDSSIVEQLLTRVGYHLQDTMAYSQPGSFGDPSDEGHKTHPYKYVRLPISPFPPVFDWESHPCFDESSVYTGFDVGSLDYAIEAQRDSIEQAHNLLYDCLYPTSEALVNDSLADSDAGVINEENVYERWNTLCEDLIDDKAAYFEEKATEAVTDAYSCPDGYLCDPSLTSGQIDEFTRCYAAAIVEYAKNLCQAPSPPRVNESFGPDDPSPIIGRDSYVVEDTQLAGTFVRYGQSEWAEFSRAGNVLVTQLPLPFNNDYDEVTDGFFAPYPISPSALKVKAWNYELDIDSAFISTVPTEEEMGLLTAIAMGTTSAFFEPDSMTDESVVIASIGDNSWSKAPMAPLFSSDFSSVTGPIPGTIDGSSSEWTSSHSGGGIPKLLFFDGDIAMTMNCGADDPATPTKVTGNGAWPEAHICFDPGWNKYELTLNLDFLNGSRIDNLYLVFEDAQFFPSATFKPELPGSGEVLYPTEINGRTVAVHEMNIHDLVSGGWQTLKSRFDFFGVDPSFCRSHRMFIYMKQELHSEPVRIAVDDITIHKLAPCILPATLYADFTLWEPEPNEPEIETCDQVVAQTLLNKIDGERQRILDKHDEILVQSYETNCTPSDIFTAEYALNYYQYTLYYYDPLGRLIRTVSPAGVDTSASFTRGDSPDHAANGTFATEYGYNGVGSLVQKSTPDAGTVHTWYDRLQRVRFTQTAQDVQENQFRYVCYDQMDRLVRSGVREFQLPNVDLSNHVDDLDWPDDDYDRVTTSDCAGCSERVYVIYDNPMDLMPVGFEQNHLTNRISFSTNEEGDTTAYSYDSKGRITSLYQHVELTGDNFTADDTLTFNHIVDYTFDPVSDNVLQININEGREDQFFHRYAYDEDQRQIAASTSTDGQIWHLDLLKSFNDVGQLQRKELGHFGVQGVDHTYNIHGQIVGINLPSGNVDDDPGLDGAASGPHAWFAPDAFAMQLSYYDGDFNRSGSFFNEGTSGSPRRAGKSYLDGSIGANSWFQRHLLEDNGTASTVGHEYKYDEIHRLTQSEWATHESEWVASSAHHAEYDFDSNGNILSLSRTGSGGTTIDALNFHYPSAGNNRLGHVTDDVPLSTDGFDLSTQSEDNYTYDESGRLVTDDSEGILMTWTSNNKVESIVRDDGSGVTYRYGPSDFMNIKSKDDSTTYYLRGPAGEELATYHFNNESGIELSKIKLADGCYQTDGDTSSTAIHGSDTRTYRRALGNRLFELHDHLGTVRTLISDLTSGTSSDGLVIEGVNSQAEGATDHFPFGMLLEDRSISTDHSQGYSSHNNMDEVNGEGNVVDMGDRWLYTRLARTAKPDVRQELYPSLSPYSYAANNPISLIDPDGKEIEIVAMVERAPTWLENLAGVKGEDEVKVHYCDEGLFLNGQPYEGNNPYILKVAKDLDRARKTDKTVASMMTSLENSKNVHSIQMTPEGSGNFARRKDPVEGVSGVGVIVFYDPENQTSSDESRRDPVIGLAHELVHAFQGQQSEWIDGPLGGVEGSIPAVEVESINMENLVRYSLKHPLRYNYWVGHDETLVPQELLINPDTGNPFGNYFNHSTNNGQTFADYASQLEMSTDELQKLNPHIQDLGNLQDGEVIIIAPETESEED